METVTFKDILNQIDDYCTNFTASTIDYGNKQRAANRAIESVKRKLGIDQRVFSFYFYEDTRFYDTPTGFNELLQLYYNTNSTAFPSVLTSSLNYNNQQNRWDVVRDIDILRNSGGYPRRNEVASTTMNAKNQLVMHGKNIHGSVILNSFNSMNGLTFSTDIVNTGIDTNIFKQGGGSLKFDINSGLSASIVTYPVALNVTSALNTVSAFRMYIDLPIGTSGFFSNVELRLLSSVGNYYTMNATTQDDGTAWTENAWDRISFSLANATTVGSPVAGQITQVQIVLNHSGTFAPVTNFRIDYLYQIFPDYMDCNYYTAYKGTDTTGATDKIILDTDSDILYFSNYAPDLIDVVAIKAALRLFPQLRGDITFWQMYKADYTDAMNNFGKIFPRKRATGVYGSSQIIR